MQVWFEKWWGHKFGRWSGGPAPENLGFFHCIPCNSTQHGYIIDKKPMPISLVYYYTLSANESKIHQQKSNIFYDAHIYGTL